MPELPEIETVRRGIEPHVLGCRVAGVRVYQRMLRWPVPRALSRDLRGRRIESVGRRGKYLMLGSTAGTVILHLGMSGSLRIVDTGQAPRRHDHLDFDLEGGVTLRLHDPRRFGAALWTTADPGRHRLLAGLGPEPLGRAFDADWLHERSRGRRVAVKAFIMDGATVAGVGNIYANEALYLAGIHPARAAGRVSLRRYAALAGAVKAVLREAIREGGTTLRDFVASDGTPGYFNVRLRAYGRAGAGCERCGATLRARRIGQRASVYCPRCQR